MTNDHSKWYTTASIPLSSIPYEELNIAFNIFSNGCKEMVDLLWNCYKNGIETLGNHIRKKSYWGYLQIDYCASNREMLKRLVDYCLDIGNCSISTSFFGNVFSGPNWDTPSISFSPNNMLATEFFRKINEAFSPNTVVNHHHITDILFAIENLVIENDWPFNPIINYDDNKIYVFEFDPNRINLSDDEKEIILSCGMEQITHTFFSSKKKKEKREIKFFGFFEYDEDAFTYRMESVLSHLMTDFRYSKPSPYDETVGIDYSAHLLKQVLLKEGAEGGKKLNEWINNHKWNPDLSDVDYY